MSKIEGKRVLVTGGASGIGKIMGRLVLEKGADTLIIWDINKESIDSVAAEYAPLGKVRGYRVDVSDAEAVAAAYAEVKRDCGEVNILINCAGIVRGNLVIMPPANDSDETAAARTSAAKNFFICCVV